MFHRAADYGDRIAKGVKPAELPVSNQPNSKEPLRLSTSPSSRPCSHADDAIE